MVTYPHGFVGPIRPGDKIAPARPIGPAPRRRRRPSTPSVRISGNTVFINGSGFSVAPDLQAEFIRQRTGGRGTSAQAAIHQATADKLAREERARQARIKAERVRADLIKRQALLRNQGAKITRKKSIDSKTKQRLIITETKLGSEKIREIRNLDTGDVTINRYGINGGGTPRLQAGITVKGKKKPVAEINLDDLSPMDAVRLANEIDVSKFQVENFGKKLTGLEKISTWTRRESTALVNKMQTGSGLNKKEKAILLGLQFAIPSQQLIAGLKQSPEFVKSLVKNPKNIIKVPGQLVTGLKETGLEIIALYKVDPALALARIAGEIVTIKLIGGGLKITGKLTRAAAIKVSPILKPIKSATVIAKTSTRGGFIKFKAFARKAKVVRKVGKIRKITKTIQKAEIKKFKAAVQYQKELKIARSARRAASKKGKTIGIGDRDFIEGVAFVEGVADKLAVARAKQFLKKFKARGGKLGLGQAENFIESTRRYVKNAINKNPTFKRLKEYSKYTEPYQVKLIKANRIQTAKKMASRLSSNIKNLPIAKQMTAILKKIKKTIKKIKKAPKKIKKKLAVRKLRKIARKELRKTNRYKMQKARGIRKVTTQQIERSLTVNQYRKFVDDFFDEMAARQKIPISNLKYRQFKNVIKKRLDKAIKAGNKAEIEKFRVAVRKVVSDMNKPAKAPSIRVVKKGTRSFKTINEFKPEVPKGKYVEIKSGQQTILQEVRQIQKVRRAQKTVQIQKVIQKPQMFVIQSVQKQTISLMPLLRFATVSLTAQAVKQVSKQKTKQVLATKQASKTLQAFGQDFAQDMKVLQKTIQASGLKFDISQKVAQDIKSKFKTLQKTKQVTKQKERPIRRRIIPDKFTRRSIPKSLPVYHIKVKKKGRMVNLLPRPLTLRDAKDYLAFKLDKNLVRTAYFEPIGRSKNVVGIPKKMKGYFTKVKRKLRPYKIKVGKKKLLRNGFIEKRKFALDTKMEKAQLKKSRAKKTKRKKR